MANESLLKIRICKCINCTCWIHFNLCYIITISCGFHWNKNSLNICIFIDIYRVIDEYCSISWYCFLIIISTWWFITKDFVMLKILRWIIFITYTKIIIGLFRVFFRIIKYFFAYSKKDLWFAIFHVSSKVKKSNSS